MPRQPRGASRQGPLLLGIDVGTSLCKAGVITADGATVGVAHVPTPWRTVPTGAEIDVTELFDAALFAARRAIGQVPRARIVGVGITSMAETGALLDEADRPITPGLAWFDTRGEAEEAELQRALGTSALARHLGLPLLRVTSLVKLAWLAANGSTGKAARWLNAAEWVAFCLGAEPVAERSLASRTGLLDQQTDAWWPATIDWLGITDTLLPPLVPAGACVGRVRPGLLPGADHAVLTIAGHDHPCAAVGAGATRPDDVLNSCGTAVALVRGVTRRLEPATMERMVASGFSVGTHVLPDQQVMLTGFVEGFGLQRMLRMLGIDEAQRARLDALAATVDAGDLRVEGIDAPTANLIGITTDVTPERVWRAALDAVEWRVADLLRIMQGEAGPHRRLIVVGGWARGPAARAAKRTILGPCVYADVAEAGVRGAGLLAGLAAGVYGSVDDWPACPVEAED